MDLPGDGIQHEVVIVRRALHEILDLLPLLPAVDIAHFQDRARPAGDHRPALELVSLSGHALGHAEKLVLYQLHVHRLRRAANREGTEALDDRRGAVGGLVELRLEHPRPQPARALLLDHRDGMALGHVEHHVTVAVQAAGAVAIDIARGPGIAVPGFPHQRRILRVDTHALDIALESQGDGTGWRGVGQANQQHVVRFRDFVEAEERGLGQQGFGVVAHLLLARQR